MVMQYNFDFSKLLKGAAQGTAEPPLLCVPAGRKEAVTNQS